MVLDKLILLVKPRQIVTRASDLFFYWFKLSVKTRRIKIRKIHFFNMTSQFFDFFGIGATLRTPWEIPCLLYAGFFLSIYILALILEFVCSFRGSRYLLVGSMIYEDLFYMYSMTVLVFNRPGVAGAVLQTPSLLIN